MNIEGYRDLKLVGEGGMAYIYKGVQESLNRDVAIKVLKQNLADEAELQERFYQESQIIAQLNHPHIIQVIDRGVTEEGSPFFVMPFVKGAGLDTAFMKQALKQHQLLDIFTQVCKGLAYAHKNKIIHCDIKPENILIDFEGHAVILDFGISHLFNKVNTEGEEQDKYIFGTDNYMAPEQHQGLSHTSAQSDIYALGVLMYRFMSRQFPESPPKSLSLFDGKIPKLLDDLILDCLNETPEERPSSAEHVKNVLLKVLQGDHLNTKQKQRAQQDVKKSFQLLDIIKETRHGAIYLFEEKNNQQLFVIKKKPVASGGYEQAKKIVDLDHPSINKLYGSSKNTRAFILVSKYCAGGSLADRLIKRFDLSEFFPIALSISQGMQAAHKAKILHGNLRPSNVLFDEENHVKLVDFGLVEHYQNSDDNWYRCQDETPTVKSDIYAVGIMFVQMLIAETQESNTSALAKKYRFSKLPSDLQLLIKQMTHKDQSKRIDSFDTVVSKLLEIFESDATVVRSSDTEIEHTPIETKRKRGNLKWLLLAAAIAAGILAAQFYLLTL